MSDNSKIGYVNYISGDYITGSNFMSQTTSAPAAGFPVANLWNQFTTHKWKPDDATGNMLPAVIESATFTTAQTVEYMGIAAHDLATRECSIAFATYDGSWTTQETVTPTDNKAIMVTFSAANVTKVRITIERVSGATDSSMPAIGHWAAGPVMTMERGMYGNHSPITLSRTTQKVVNETEGGQFSGNSIVREGVQTNYEWKNLTPAWYRSTFDPFVVNARDKAFFIKWFPTTYPLEVGFVWAITDIKPSNSGVGAGLMDVSMEVKGYTDE